MAKSIRAQLAAVITQIGLLQTKEAELRAQVAVEVDPSRIVETALVTFKSGKGEKAVNVQGTVIGVKHPAEGEKGETLYKLAVGQGFDATTPVVKLAQIVAVDVSPIPEAVIGGEAQSA